MVNLADDGTEDNLPDKFLVVADDKVAEIVSEILGIPVGKLDQDKKAKLIRLDDDIEKRVKGQDVAVWSVLRAFCRARSGLWDQTNPMATFMIYGPL